MRHKKGFNHLGRKKGHRRAMLANMASSLIMHKRITTTVAKAKALRSYVEPLITKSKQDETHSRRVVFSYLNDKSATAELFREVSPKVADRPGGYTRIIKLPTRLGEISEKSKASKTTKSVTEERIEITNNSPRVFESSTRKLRARKVINNFDGEFNSFVSRRYSLRSSTSTSSRTKKLVEKLLDDEIDEDEDGYLSTMTC